MAETRQRHRRLAKLTALVAVGMFVAAAYGPRHADAAFPGRNGRIALSLATGSDLPQPFNSADADLFTVGPSGDDPRRITDGPYADYYPDWSPDGRRIVFSRAVPPWQGFYTGLQDIYVVDADGRKAVNLTATPDFAETRPAWSPDGKRIVFQGRSPLTLTYQLYVMDADGDNIRQLTTAGNYPNWSPDGQWIAFIEGGAIELIRPDGSGRHRLHTTDPDANGPEDAWDADWSPDGDQLIFQYGSRADADRLGDIYLIDRDGTHLRNLTSGFADPAGYPAWSPDGRKIAFMAIWADEDATFYEYAVFTMNADGSRIAPLVKLRLNAYAFPDWGPRA